MSVFMIIDIEVRDKETYAEYVKKAEKIVKKYGGRYLVQGGRISSISGDWNPQRIVIIEFASRQALNTCFSSEEYKSIAYLRERSTNSRTIAVDGCEKYD